MVKRQAAIFVIIFAVRREKGGGGRDGEIQAVRLRFLRAKIFWRKMDPALTNAVELCAKFNQVESRKSST